MYLWVVLQTLVKNSVMGSFYGKAVDCIVALRTGCVMQGEAGAYNATVRVIHLDVLTVI